MTSSRLSNVEHLAKQLPPADQLRLVERLVHDLRMRDGQSPVDLYGAW